MSEIQNLKGGFDSVRESIYLTPRIARFSCQVCESYLAPIVLIIGQQIADLYLQSLPDSFDSVVGGIFLFTC